MSHPYVTTDGKPSAREITLHYVTICAQIDAHDRLLARLYGGLMKFANADSLMIDVTESTLRANEIAWNRRAQLVEARTTAFAALVEKCGGDQSKVDSYVSTVAKEFGITLELAK